MFIKRFRFFCYIITLSLSLSAAAQDDCFIASENGVIIIQNDRCNIRHSPASTFKIALAVMGFDSGILKSPTEPLIEFNHERRIRLGNLYDPIKYPSMLWYELPQNPSTWMFNSVIWYSQEIAFQLGMDRLKQYITILNYGNMNVSGSANKDDGLLSSWLYSSLKISPLEQLRFIERLSNKRLPLSKQAQQKTIDIMRLEDLSEGWSLYGKTGGGKSGWFVGWAEKNNRRIIFVQYVEPTCNPLRSSGKIAKEQAKDNLIKLMCTECLSSFDQNSK